MEALATVPFASFHAAGESVASRVLAARRIGEALAASSDALDSLERAVIELAPPSPGERPEDGRFVLTPLRTPWGLHVDVLSVQRATRASMPIEPDRGLVAVLPATTLGLTGAAVELRALRVVLEGQCAPAWDFAGCAVPYPGLDASGDAIVLCSLPRDGLRAGVIDALGHGPGAARSAAGLVAHVLASERVALAQVVASAHARRVADPRGAAMSLVDLGDGGVGGFVGIGNVDAVALGGATRPVSRPGTIGVAMSHLVVDPVTVPRGGSLVLASDGFGVRWAPFTLEAVGRLPAPLILCALIATAQRRTDDATALVVQRTGGA